MPTSLGTARPGNGGCRQRRVGGWR